MNFLSWFWNLLQFLSVYSTNYLFKEPFNLTGQTHVSFHEESYAYLQINITFSKTQQKHTSNK